MMIEFLSSFINLGKYKLGFWKPFWARGLSEPSHSWVSSTAPKTQFMFAGLAGLPQENL